MLTLNLGNRMRTGHWLLPVMLWPLHGALIFGVESQWAQPLLLVHLGLFLLWQPLWRSEIGVGRGALAFVLLAAAVVMFWMNWWAIAFWLIGMFGLAGARVFDFRDRWARLLYLAVMTYLLVVLLLWVIPHLLDAQYAIEVGSFLVNYVLTVLLAVLVLSPAKRAALPEGYEAVERAQAVNYIYSLLLFMLLIMVVFGCFAFMALAKLTYPEALLHTLFLIGFVLLALGMLWTPRFGFNGLQVMFSRHLLSFGMPLESWLVRLATAAQREPDPVAYLRRAVILLADFPWLSGLAWQSPDGAGQIGQSGKHDVHVQEGCLRLTLYAKKPFDLSMLPHAYLLAQLIGYFYQAKLREQSLRDITRLQVVHETGSCLTHDLKNILQTLLSLTDLAQSSEEEERQLLRQQIPQLTQYIEQALRKLKPLQAESTASQLSLAAWCDAAQLRYRHQNIVWRMPCSDINFAGAEVAGGLAENRQFAAGLDGRGVGAPSPAGCENHPNVFGWMDMRIPATLFDAVLSNLLDNALQKRQTQPDIVISVELHVEPMLRMLVCDSGEAIPATLAAGLLRKAVASQNGLGVGLYQAARWAEQLGYRLELCSNQRGKVCFELRVN